MLKVAVVGATGAVGREMLAELEYFEIPCNLLAFASERSAGEKLKFRGEEITVEAFDLEGLKGSDFVLMSAGGDFSKEHARAIAELGCVVIDNSSAWRMSDGVPLVVPEVNPEAIGRNKIIANPNCSTIQLVVSLLPLAKMFGIDSVNVCTYQSVSGSGQAGINELAHQLEQHAKEANIEANKYPQPIFNNLLPAIDIMRPGGHCFEEEKMIRETRKIMAAPDLDVIATTVRVPVFKCHSEAVTVKLCRKVTRNDVIACFTDADGIEFSYEDSYDAFAYPRDVAGSRDVKICRARLPFGQDASQTVQYWNVADNLKKGAATNAVQILKYHVDNI